MAAPRIIVVGGGLAGLAAVIKIAEAGGTVDLFSIVPVKRSHSVCAQGGINAAKNLKGEGDTTDKHFDDTIYGGDFLANQTPVKAMCEAAPGIIDLLDRMGVPFNRTPEGLLDFRRFGGTLYQPHRIRRRHHRPAASLRARRAGPPLRVRRQSQEVRRLGVSLRRPRLQGRMPAASPRSTSAPWNSAPFPPMPSSSPPAASAPSSARAPTPSSAPAPRSRPSSSRAPTTPTANSSRSTPPAIPGEDKLRLMSESARGEGGRVWVPRTAGDKRPIKQIPESERFYFLEEWYPKYGNLVPRDVATRAIHKVVYEHGLGIDGQPMVYLDLTHIDRETLNRKLEGILEIYEKFVGDDPARSAHEDLPRHALHHGRPLGRLQPDDQHPRHLCRRRVRIPVPRRQSPRRQFARQLHLRRIPLPAPTPSSTPRACRPAKAMAATQPNSPARPKSTSKLINNEGTENPFKLWRELGETMTEHATVIRYNKGLKQADEKIVELLDRFKKVNLSDRSQWANTSFAFARQLEQHARALARRRAAARSLRDESRGAHYKPDFPDRNDEKFLKTTKASFTGAARRPAF